MPPSTPRHGAGTDTCSACKGPKEESRPRSNTCRACATASLDRRRAAAGESAGRVARSRRALTTVRVNLTPSEFALLAEMAAHEEMSLPEFLRDAGVKYSAALLKRRRGK